MLRAELGIPDTTQSFSVHFAVGEPVSVRCEYTPRERLIASAARPSERSMASLLAEREASD